jgi:hypothetical protein
MICSSIFICKDNIVAKASHRKHGGRRKKAGRKPLLEGDRRRHRVVVHLTDDEFATLEDIADSMEMFPGAAAYELLTRAFDWYD